MKELFLEISMNAGWLGSLGRTGGGGVYEGGGVVYRRRGGVYRNVEQDSNN